MRNSSKKLPMPDEINLAVAEKLKEKEKRGDRIQVCNLCLQGILAVTMIFYTACTFYYTVVTRKLVDQGKEQYRLTIEPHLTVEVLDFDNQNWDEVKAKIMDATKDKENVTQNLLDEEQLSILHGRLTEENKQLRFYCLVRNYSNQIANKVGVYIFDYRQKNYLACFGRRDALREKTRLPFSGFTDNLRTIEDIEHELNKDYGSDAEFAYPFLSELPKNHIHDESVVFVFYKDIQGRVYCYRQIFGWGRWGIFKDKIVNFDEWVDHHK